jgi:WD40 repeat protein
MVRVCRLGRGVSALALSVALLAAFAQQASALGAGGLKGTQASQYPSLSQDGRYLAFSTGAPLASSDAGFFTDVYVRDLDTGLTLLASRANGASGAAGNGGSIAQRRPSISGNGRYVVFESGATNLSPDDADTTNDVYVRDMQANSTILVSRATGAAGAKVNAQSWLAELSADGRYVVFQSDAALDPADTDTSSDIYMRDLQTDTTILVSRANGVNGANAAAQANTPSVSQDGRYVAFASTAANLTADDPDTTSDVFIRDTQTGATTLASRATGAAGAKGNGFSGQAQISADGNHVAWTANASNLDPADPDSVADAYVRDLQSSTTSLVGRATGVNGAKANAFTGIHSISADGRYVGFGTSATNLDPDDNDAPGLYVRDVQTSTTSLVDRASGASGAKASPNGFNLALSGDGRFATFFTGATNLSPDDTSTTDDVYVRDLQTFFTSLESRATPGHVRPKGATPLRVALVPSYSQCTAPTRTHGPPLAFPSCTPPGQRSPNLTVGSPDANGAPANSSGSVLLDVLPGDFRIVASITDVRCAASLPTCGAANTAGGADYAGELRATMAVRRTDKYDSSVDAIPATLGDTSFGFTFGCSGTAASQGAACSVTTTANSLVPGLVRNGDRTAMEIGAIELLDGGPDGDADTADNSTFATQGIFIP